MIWSVSSDLRLNAKCSENEKTRPANRSDGADDVDDENDDDVDDECYERSC